MDLFVFISIELYNTYWDRPYGFLQKKQVLSKKKQNKLQYGRKNR